ncbi:unnamed protein product [Ceratitis capitata]|uniref:(Mediterranean fruit fly) hypothetical protein n=1 Tax=Ceratitis capitata TaxID=7213 RepID=A0A811V219_CERCA|nr:unnamed protein product [Ceratitis capitata]
MIKKKKIVLAPDGERFRSDGDFFGDVTTSFLLIQNADLADSGKYSCAPSNADVASVRVHVLNDACINNHMCETKLATETKNVELGVYGLEIHRNETNQ